MIKVDEARNLVDEIFEQQALLIGGILAVYGMEDKTVWRLIRNMDVIRWNVMFKLDELEDEDDIPDDVLQEKNFNLKPHPAIEGFLGKIREDGFVRERYLFKSHPLETAFHAKE